MESPPDLPPDLLRALARKHGLPEPLVRLPSPGVVNRVYAGAGVVLRVPDPAHPDGQRHGRTESVAVPAVTRAGLRTPALLVFDDDRDMLDVPITVYARAPGRSLQALGWPPGDPRARRAWTELGAELARVHQRVREVPDPQGWLSTPGRGDGRSVVEGLARDGFITAEEAGWAARVVERAADIPTPPARFLHGDLQPGNILADEAGQLTALIDWGDAGWGEPALEFPALPLRALPTLLAGYRSVAPELLGEGVEGRVLADVLVMALARLRRMPSPREVWNARPGSVLVELLRFALEAGPGWAGWLRP